jgi:KAP-like P-loop domain-containing protein
MTVETEEGFLGELIPDHALVAEEHDLFGHTDFVERLVTVVEEASTEHSSANIALYGAWGSGKSSMGNLFEARLEEEADKRRADDEEPEYRFFRFDAFKYARKPFLRQFIRELSAELLDDEDKVAEYQDRLYEERSQVEPRFRVSWRKLAMVTVALIVVFAALLRFLQGTAHDIVLGVLVLGLLAVVPPSSLLGLLRLAVPFFSLTSKTAVPDSEEQFEGIFCDVLVELGIDGEGDQKLVVFVDELDRCSPAEVATTLETLRTFLGVPGCVFLVAADQHVLEQALTEHVRQATPPDTANPYYSAGSAYLDKIFQYQLALPPVRVRRLVDFALELVEGRPGVWEEANLTEVIPVLLPTHIHSPRRVKVLLNAFALIYGVARRRSEFKELGENIEERAAEIAKLVCLRVEFPLFSRDLILDERLAPAVVAAAMALERGEDPSSAAGIADLPVEIRRRAISFARGDLPTAHLFAEASAERGLNAPLVDYEDPQVEKEQAPQEAASPDGPPERPAAPVRHVQGLQLVRYLEKTIDVPGPRADLIHLEATGVEFNLDLQTAQQLERDALDGRQDAVLRTVMALDRKDRVNALRMLGQRAHESHGIDGRNVMQCLLRAVAESEVQLRSIAPALAVDLEAFRRRNDFEAGDLPGALTIAVNAKRPHLVELLMRRPEALSDASFRGRILALTRPLYSDWGQRLFAVLAEELRVDGATAAHAVLHVPKRLHKPLISGANLLLQETMEEIVKAIEEEPDPEQADSGAAALDGEIVQLAIAVGTLAAKDPPLAERTALSLLRLPKRFAGETTIRSLREMPPVSDAELVGEILNYACQWTLPQTAELLATISPPALGAYGTRIDALVGHIWDETSEGAGEIPAELLAALKRLFSARGKQRGELGPRARELFASLQVRVDSAEAADGFEGRLDAARRLAKTGLIPEEGIAGAVAETIASTVRPPLGPGVEDGAVLGHLSGWVDFVAMAGVEQIRHAHAALLEEDCWLPSPARDQFELQLAALLRKHGERPSTPTASRIAELVDVHGRAAAPVAAIWIESFAGKPDPVVKVIMPFASSPPAEIVTALQRYSRNRIPQRTRLARPLIAYAFQLRTSPRTLRALRADAAEEPELVDAVCALATSATNLDQRRIVFDQWEGIDPREPGSWKRLLEEVMLPFARDGAKSFDLVRTRLRLCHALPSELAPALVKGLRAAVPAKDEERAVALERSLSDAQLLD